jgi:hypothetical protein
VAGLRRPARAPVDARARGEEGSILLDVLVALFIVMVGFAVFLGGMSVAASLSVRQDERVRAMIEQRSGNAKASVVLFQKQ